MAWDFETDAEYQEKLDWVEQFVTEDVEPLDYVLGHGCLLYTSPSPRDRTRSRMPSSA